MPALTNHPATPIAVGAVMGATTSAVLNAVGPAPPVASHAILLAAIATPYLAFAAADGRLRAVGSEAFVVAGLFVAALAFFDGPAMPVVVALVAHAVWDIAHIRCDITTVVRWWPPWCAAFDLAAAGGLAGWSLLAL